MEGKGERVSCLASTSLFRVRTAIITRVGRVLTVDGILDFFFFSVFIYATHEPHSSRAPLIVMAVVQAGPRAQTRKKNNDK